MANPNKRRQTLIDKYGSWDAYQRAWQAKRKQTLIDKLGEDGYKKYLATAGTKGGKTSKRGKAKEKGDS